MAFSSNASEMSAMRVHAPPAISEYTEANLVVAVMRAELQCNVGVGTKKERCRGWQHDV